MCSNSEFCSSAALYLRILARRFRYLCNISGNFISDLNFQTVYTIETWFTRNIEWNSNLHCFGKIVELSSKSTQT